MKSFTITDNSNKNQLHGVNEMNVREMFEDWWDMSQDGVNEAIENIEDYMAGRLNEPMWATDFMGITIEQEF